MSRFVYTPLCLMLCAWPLASAESRSSSNEQNQRDAPAITVELKDGTLTLKGHLEEQQSILVWRKYELDDNTWIANAIPFSLEEKNSLAVSHTTGLTVSGSIRGVGSMKLWLATPDRPYRPVSNVLLIEQSIQERGLFISGKTNDGYYVGGRSINGTNIVGVYEKPDVEKIVAQARDGKDAELLRASEVFVARQRAKEAPQIEVRGVAAN